MHTSFRIAAYADRVNARVPIPGACFRCSWLGSCSIFRLRCFLFTLPTDSSQLDINPVDAAHLGHLPRHRKPIHFVVVEIANHPALRADEVVVPIRVGIKPCSVAHGAHAGYYAVVFEQSQCSIESVYRDGRDLLAHTREERLGVGVFLAGGQLPKNLGSLMSGLDALPTANLQKLRNAFFRLFSWLHSKLSIRNDYDVGTIHHLGAAFKHNFNNTLGGRNKSSRAWQVALHKFTSAEDQARWGAVLIPRL